MEFTDLEAANKEIERLKAERATAETVREIPVSANTKRVVIPREFPAGFGFAGHRASLNHLVREHLQKAWDSLSDDAKVQHLLNLEQHVEQPVPQAPHRLAV